MVRARRQVHDHRKNTCPLLLVADHRFFKHMGREEESTTLNYLVTRTSVEHAQSVGGANRCRFVCRSN